jgi:cysteine desulfurase
MMKVYLDNAATTKPYSEVVEIMNDVLKEDYGNPSSMHIKGYEAEKYLKEARNIISKLLKVDAKEIYFTSGGTESNNMALIGAAMANKRRGKHIISTRIEHASVYNPLLFLQEMGYEVEFINVDSNGRIVEEELRNTLRDDTILVSTMYVNNEVGSIQDIASISKIIKDFNKEIVYHVDAIQAFGKVKIFPKKLGVDLLSISGHKIHGPKGSGVIYIKDKTKIRNIVYGGGQEKDFRSGTENVPAIAGLGKAAALIYDDFDNKINKMYELKQYMIDCLSRLEDVTINAVEFDDIKETAPHIVSASFAGVRSEVLLHSLEEKGVYVSAGSACASNHPQISGTLKAINVKQDLLDSTIRFSFSTTTTKEEIDYAIECLGGLLGTLRRYKRH